MSAKSLSAHPRQDKSLVSRAVCADFSTVHELKSTKNDYFLTVKQLSVLAERDTFPKVAPMFIFNTDFLHIQKCPLRT